LLAIKGFRHLKAIMFQVHADKARHALLIIHNEDAAAVKFFGHVTLSQNR
jgi:hypothetical protein